MIERQPYPLYLPRESYDFAIRHVDSENFIPFLLFPMDETGGQTFAKHLDLSSCAPQLQELAASAPDVPLYDSAYQAAQKERHEKLGVEQENDIPAQVMVKGESGRMVYFNIDTGKVVGGVITQGGKNSVALDMSEASDTLIPLMPAHIHPTTSLFSPLDYRLLLTSDKDTGLRKTKGMVVLCPDMQLVALATAQTPLFDPEKAYAHTTKWDEKIERVKEVIENTRVEKQKRIYTEYEIDINTMEEKARIQYMHIRSACAHGELTATEKDEKEALLMVGVQARVNIRLQQYEKALKASDDEYHQARWHDVTTLLMAFARESRVALYMASDFIHFSAFSA